MAMWTTKAKALADEKEGERQWRRFWFGVFVACAIVCAIHRMGYQLLGSWELLCFGYCLWYVSFLLRPLICLFSGLRKRW
jgi:hypothetical protein